MKRSGGGPDDPLGAHPDSGTAAADPREAAKRRFLAQAGWSAADRAPLAGDASARRYDRLRWNDAGPAGALHKADTLPEAGALPEAGPLPKAAPPPEAGALLEAGALPKADPPPKTGALPEAGPLPKADPPAKTGALPEASAPGAGPGAEGSPAPAASMPEAERPPAASAVLMDAPPDRGEDIGAFLALTGWLRMQGFAAPGVLAADPGAGFALLEDLGDALFARVCAAQPSLEPALYAAATDLLAALHRIAPPAAIAWSDGLHLLNPYDLETLHAEAALTPHWYLTAAGAEPGRDAMAEFDAVLAEALAEALEGAAASRDVVVLRDYHAENLVWRPATADLSAGAQIAGDAGSPAQAVVQAVAQVGLLDYQDALRGHPAYDLVSLLEDARRDTGPDLRAAMIGRYLDATGREAAPFATAYAALGAQRNLKIIGIFTRLWRRDGKPGYLAMIPRVWAHLQRDLAHPGLAGLRHWVARHMPPPGPALLARIGRSR
ncbi:MAG: phosphotransferase [Pseudomonadota bacterium]